jgi:hypothetical protein
VRDCAIAFSDNRRSKATRSWHDWERLSQKQVANISSYFVSRHDLNILERICSPVPMVKARGRDVVTSFAGSVAKKPSKRRRQPH